MPAPLAARRSSWGGGRRGASVNARVWQESLAILVGIYGHNHRAVADTLSSMAAVRFAQVRRLWWGGGLELLVAGVL